MLLLVYLFFGFFGASSAESADPERRQICPGGGEGQQPWYFVGELNPELTDTERRLVCGDPDTSDAVGKAWKEIPFNQAQFHLKTFLQDRALYRPVFRELPGHSGWEVELGPESRAEEVVLDGAPAELDFGRKRAWRGERLTPRFLEAMEQWLVQRLQSLGYACPELTSSADAVTGKISIQIRSGLPQDLVSLVEEEIPGLHPGILRRYDAFQLGRRFNGELLSISTRRVTTDGVVQSVHFTPTCQADGVHLKQETLPGQPRLLRFGFSIDTEGLLKGRASWSNTRLWSSASLMDVTGRASAREQSLIWSMRWYNFPYSSRRHFRPESEIRHENKESYEFLSARAGVSHASSWENESLAMSGAVGPELELFRQLRGAGPDNSKFLALRAELRAVSHSFEFYRTSPRSGFSASLVTFFNSRNVGSDATAQRYRFKGEALWNLRNYDPPLLILGLRGGLGLTVTGERPGVNIQLPTPFRYYLGGAGDLRGFGLVELAGSKGQGSLSSSFAGFEARLGSVLPFGLQPLAFLDAGMLGSGPVRLDTPAYWSPGLGLRWESPIGSLRATYAHGYVTGAPASPNSHGQFYLSLGDEF